LLSLNPGDADYENYSGGTATPTSLLAAPSTSSAPFGFDDAGFAIPGLNDDVPPAFAFYIFNSSHTMRWEDKTLVEIGAGAFANTLAWTSAVGGNHTVSFTTVPEPSSVAMGALGIALGAFRRRK
ncbi:MAG: PEP-CTERM sorting domain-containing protein, partial [Akkermansiaceae bacterium]